MKLRPLLNRILVKPLEAEEMSGGIYLPPVARDEEMLQGLVVEVGEGLPTPDGEKVVPCKVKKGDKVLFQKYAGSEVMVEEDKLRFAPEDPLNIKHLKVKHLLIPEGNILAKLE